MVLFNKIVQVLHWAQFTIGLQSAFLLQFAHSFWVSRVPVNVDHTRRYRVRGTPSFADEPLGGGGITSAAEHTLYSMTSERSILPRLNGICFQCSP